MLRIVWYVMLLVATTAIICGAQNPKGVLTEQADGSYVYTVSDDDRLGQWQVACGSPALWQELVKANPQLEDPDLIRPGDRLNVPPSMIGLFRFMIGSHNLATTTHDTVFVPDNASGDKDVPTWLWVGLIIALAFIMYRFGIIRTKTEDEEKRRLEDPYYGTNRVEGGLPTVEAALAYFTNMYENDRLGMSVQEAQYEPPLVHIVRIVPVDVKGPMWISYGHPDDPVEVEKDIPNWIPAWQCWLDDGSYRLSLMVCGNDVRSGLGMTPLSEDQIRPRQDMKAVELHQQIWPIISAKQQQAETTEHLDIPSDVPRYREIRIKSATCFILLDHKGGSGKEIDVSSLGDSVNLSVKNGLIIAEIGGKQQVIGQIGEKDPLEGEIHAENDSLIASNDRSSADDAAKVVD